MSAIRRSVSGSAVNAMMRALGRCLEIRRAVLPDSVKATMVST